MPPTPAQYRLVVFDELDDPRPVRDLFAQALGVHPTDAAQWVARVPGVWPKLLGENDVRKLLDGLYALEVAAEAWRVDAFPDIRRPRTIHEAACIDGGLRITGLRGEPTHWVPWDKVEMIAAGTIAADDSPTREATPPGWVNALSTGFRAAIGRAPRAARKARGFRTPRDPVGEVLIVRRDPLVAFRVVANQMNYAYLGDRLQAAAIDNFPVFLADLIRLARGAIVTPTTAEMLDPSDEIDPDDYEFASTQGLVDYATLRLLWGWYRRDREKLEGTDEHRQLP